MPLKDKPIGQTDNRPEGLADSPVGNTDNQGVGGLKDAPRGGTSNVLKDLDPIVYGGYVPLSGTEPGIVFFRELQQRARRRHREPHDCRQRPVHREQELRRAALRSGASRKLIQSNLHERRHRAHH